MTIFSKLHELHTFKYYPKAFYFVNRLQDVYPRFRRVTEQFPEHFHDKRWLQEIRIHCNHFTKPPALIVIGNAELPFTRLVATRSPDDDIKYGAISSGLKVAVCYASIERADSDGIQVIEQSLQQFYNSYGASSDDIFNRLFVVCDIETSMSVQDLSSFRSTILSRVQRYRNGWPYSDHIILRQDGASPGEKISEVLESFVMEGFDMIHDYLHLFLTAELTNMGKRPTGRLVDDSRLEMVLQTFVKDEISLGDMQSVLEQEQGTSSRHTVHLGVSEQFLVYALDDLARRLKCTIVQPLCERYNMLPWICSGLLEHWGCERKIKEALSASTRYKITLLDDRPYHYQAALRKREALQESGALRDRARGAGARSTTRNKRGGKFDYVVANIKNDLTDILYEAEKVAMTGARLIKIMEKMTFEIDGYFHQSDTRPNKHGVVPILNTQLREEIMRIDKVFGTGMFHGRLEIHIVERDEVTEQSLDSLLSQFNYTQPYRIHVVDRKPTPLASVQHENGKPIKCQWPDGHEYREGTLGGFAEEIGKKDRLFALTCAHVVSNNVEQEVLVEDKARTFKLLGRSSPGLTITSGTTAAKLVDFAAVQVDPSMKQHCVRFLKDESGFSKRTIVANGNVTDECSSYVFKFGAKTHYTKGLICSKDFTLKLNKDFNTDYILVIEPLPDVQIVPFAQAGDSGSIVCAPIPNDVDHIKSICMITSGDYRLEEDDVAKCMCFQLQRGFDALKDQSGLRLTMPG